MPKNRRTPKVERIARRKRLAKLRIDDMRRKTYSHNSRNPRQFKRTMWRRLIGKQRRVIRALRVGELTRDDAREKFDRIKRHRKNGEFTFDNFAGPTKR